MNNARKTQHNPYIHQALLNELLKRSSEAVVLLNTDAEIVFCSQSIKSITGYDTEELIGKSVFDFLYPADSAATQQLEYLVSFGENTSASLIQFRTRQGQTIWIDLNVKKLLHLPEVNAVFVLLKKSTDAATEERKLAQAVMQAKEQERQFIASELHDNINQVITATKLLVDTARLIPDKEELLQLCSSNLQLVADEIRKLSYSMVSHDLQEFGLTFAVNAFMRMISSACGVRFQARIEEGLEKALTADQQLHVYRIIQESTNNIILHAEADLAEITLTRQNDLINVIIADNGKGFSANRHKPSMGLSSIIHRVKLLQGHVHIRSPQGTGTTIEIHFPV